MTGTEPDSSPDSKKPHLQVLNNLRQEAGIHQSHIATLFGFNSPSAVSMLLNGKREMDLDKLLKMCEILNISLIQLAAMSNDLPLTRTVEAAQAAAMLDGLEPQRRADALGVLRLILSNPL